MNFPFKSTLDIIEDIQARNVAFHKLDAETQRKEIAYDLYKLVMAGLVHNSYCSYWSGTFLHNSNNATTPSELHAYLNTIADGVHTHKCTVCARGGMMLSQIRLGNTLDPHDQNLTTGAEYNLIGFTLQEFNSMEHLYEGRAFYDARVKNHPHYPNSKARLVNICLNVIVNGEFNMDDTTDYLNKFNITL